MIGLIRRSRRRQVGKLSIDDRSGDFVEYCSPLDINLRTLFHFRKPFPPRIDPCAFKRPVPAQPIPLAASGMVGAWIWGGAPLTGAQLDSIGETSIDLNVRTLLTPRETPIVAGPKRPAAPAPPPAPRQPLISWGRQGDEPLKSATVNTTVPKRTAVGKQKAPTKVAGERDDV